MSEIKLDLDPKKILQSLNDVGDETKELAQKIEDALGKQAPASVEKLVKSTEKGSNDISTYFRNLGKRVKEDLKSAFDIGGLMGGLKLAKELSDGVKSVFDLEKAFDRLNTRLQLTGKNYADFRKQVGAKVASTGQKMEDVMPGVETAAAKGGVTSPTQLANIAESLGKVRAATGESTEALSDAVVEILKTQGKKVTGDTFKSTLDALQATRVSGAFKTAGDAGSAIEQISPYAKQFGMGTREMGGLAATASKAGNAGQDILRQLIEKASQAGGGTALNALLGQQVFKVGKEGQTTGINYSALGKIDTKRFGGMSQQILESATGIQGAAGGDLVRFIQAFKGGMGDFNKVTQGANETSKQFQVATNNLASSLDKFKEKTKNAGRQIGDDLSTAALKFKNKDYKGAIDSLKGAAANAYENKGVIGGALALTAGAGLLAGGGINSLLKKIPGAGGMVGGLVGAEAAKAAGIQPVYVTNASEIGGGMSGGLLKNAAGALKMAGKATGVVGAVAGGLEAGNYLANTETGKKVGNTLNPVIDKVFKTLGVGGVGKAQQDLDAAQAKSKARFGGGDAEHIANAVAKGVENGMNKANKNKTTKFSNPSRPPGIGSGM